MLAMLMVSLMTWLPASGSPDGDPGFYVETLYPEAESETSPTLQIGHAVELRLRFEAPSFDPAQIDDIEMAADPERWHVQSSWRKTWPEGSTTESPPVWHALVRPFALGELATPPTTVTLRAETADSVAAAWGVRPGQVEVLSIRPETAEDDPLIPLRDPRELPRQWGPVLLLALLVLALLCVGLLLGWLWRRRARRPRVAPPEPVLPPGLWALGEIDRRSRLPEVNSAPAKVVFTHVSEVIRLYLERRFGFPAMDLTSTECLGELARSGLDPRMIDWFRAFFDECDLIKFTRSEPDPKRRTAIWDDARVLVRETTPPEELNPEAATPEREEAV